jgi:PBP1b-binding outer membrane lipoprotein LpoB
MERTNEELNEMWCAEKQTSGEFNSEQATSTNGVRTSGAKTKKNDDAMESEESELESDVEEGSSASSRPLKEKPKRQIRQKIPL